MAVPSLQLCIGKVLAERAKAEKKRLSKVGSSKKSMRNAHLKDKMKEKFTFPEVWHTGVWGWGFLQRG